MQLTLDPDFQSIHSRADKAPKPCSFAANSTRASTSKASAPEHTTPDDAAARDAALANATSDGLRGAIENPMGIGRYN
jgi:hypothetical protein